MLENLIIIGYSGHSFVAIDIAIKLGYTILGYCDIEIKAQNPYQINYLGKELDSNNLGLILQNNYFIAVGHNQYRFNIQDDILRIINKSPISLIHPLAIISRKAYVNNCGVIIMPNATINAFATIGKGTIINTGAIIEHECKIGDFCHIAPGAVLAGNVTMGDLSFVGANAVVKQGVTIGKNVTIGAGTVVLSNVPDGVTIVGNPGRII